MQENPRWDLGAIVEELRQSRQHWREGRCRELLVREFPSREALRDIVALLRGALFPLRLGPADLRREGEDFFVGHALDTALNALLAQIRLELHCRQRGEDSAVGPELIAREASHITAQFAHALPQLRRMLDTDVEAAHHGDPSARSVDEVLLCHPGVLALIHHRLAHELYNLGVPLIARIIAELAHAETGIDIHPGAQIGPYCFIDHGTGVVVGETAEIGARVRIEQAVTLGAAYASADDDGGQQRTQPRHPVIEDAVVIHAGASILGRVVIGRGSVIAGKVWLTRSVPPGSRISLAHGEIRDELAHAT